MGIQANAEPAIAELDAGAGMAEVAAELGLAYEATARWKQLPKGVRRWVAAVGGFQITERFHGDVEGQPIEMFELPKVHKRSAFAGYARTAHNLSGQEGGTIVLMRAAGLPEFRIDPRRPGMSLVRSFLGLEGVSFDPRATASDEQTAAVRRFNRAFRLIKTRLPAKLDFTTLTPQLDRWEMSVRAVFTPTVMAELGDFRDWSMAVYGDRLGLWLRGVFPEPVLRPRLLADALDLAKILTTAASHSEESAPPARRGSSYAEQCRRLILAPRRGYGAFLFFALAASAILWFWNVSSLIGDQSRTSSYVLISTFLNNIGTVLIMSLLASLFGWFVGYRFVGKHKKFEMGIIDPRNLLPPFIPIILTQTVPKVESVMDRPAAIGGALAGFFMGPGVLGLLFFNRILILNELDSFWLIVLFFNAVIGVPYVMAALCGWLASLLEIRRRGRKTYITLAEYGICLGGVTSFLVMWPVTGLAMFARWPRLGPALMIVLPPLMTALGGLIGWHKTVDRALLDRTPFASREASRPPHPRGAAR